MFSEVKGVYGLFKALAEASPHPIILLDGTVIRYANPKALQLIGENCLQRDILDFLDEGSGRCLRQALQKDRGTFEVRFRGKAGTLKADFFKLDSKAVLTLRFDVESVYRKIFEISPSPIAVVDSNGVVRDANFSMKGFAGVNIIGKKLGELFSKERADRIMSYVNLALMGNTVVEFDDELGDRKLVSYCIPADLEGERLCFIISHDVTEFYRLNRLLERIVEASEAMIKLRSKSKLIESVESTLSDYSARILDRPEGVAFKIEFGNISYGYLCVKNADYAERRLLKTLAKNLAFALKAVEDEVKKEEFLKRLVENTKVIAYLVDRIRNPLTAIRAFAEVMISDDKVRERITQQVDRITGIIKNLDASWAKSEEIVGKVDVTDLLHSENT